MPLPDFGDLNIRAVISRPGMQPPGGETHAVHELIYVVDGRYQARLAGSVWTVGAGWVVYYPAGTHHRIRSLDDGTTRLLLVQWSGGADQAPWTAPFRCRDRSGRILGALEWLLRSAPPHQRRDPLLRTALLTAVRCALEAEWRPAPPVDDAVQATIASLHDAIGEPIRLADLARMVGLAPGTLSRRFVAEVGVPPMRYLATLRLERALQRIISTREPLASIAASIACRSPFHLSAEIRRAYGRSPRELRRQASSSAQPLRP